MNTKEIEWRTADGRTLTIAEMDDNHLKNAIKYINREFAREDGSIYTTFMRSRLKAMEFEVRSRSDCDKDADAYNIRCFKGIVK